jgi:predicted short-subunit dehydrogenase-like oxidoreductase (DUF2520 family)
VKIVLIGAGNVAVNLAATLSVLGLKPYQIYNRTKKAVRNIAENLQIQYTTDIKEIVDDADLYILAISDNAIEGFIAQLSDLKGLIVHTAGSVPMDVFASKFKNYGVLYPLQTFSASKLLNFRDIPIFIEANTDANLLCLNKLANILSCKVHIATSEERMRLHLAAVFACNFVNRMYSLSAEVLMQSGFSFDVLSALITETAEKAIISGNPKNVQTGPAARNDTKTITNHLEMLKTQPNIKNIYSVLTDNILASSNFL